MYEGKNACTKNGKDEKCRDEKRHGRKMTVEICVDEELRGRKYARTKKYTNEKNARTKKYRTKK